MGALEGDPAELWHQVSSRLAWKRRKELLVGFNKHGIKVNEIHCTGSLSAKLHGQGLTVFKAVWQSLVDIAVCVSVCCMQQCITWIYG